MADRELKVIISGDPKGLQRAFGKAESSSSKLASGFAKVGKAAVLAGAALATGLAVGAVKAINAASDLGEQLAKTGVVFGENAKDVHKWSAGLADDFGLSQRAALEASGTFGNMLVPMGFTRKEAAGMSKDFVELAADMASFNNASPVDTLDALRAGLAGETEPLRRFGVFLNDARIKAQALEMGLYSGKGALEAQAKAAASAAIIMKDTADTQGDFGRTSDSLANQQRILKAELENSAAAIGQALLPAATKLVTLLASVIPVVTEFGVKLAEMVAPHILAGVNALEPTFQRVKVAVQDLANGIRQLLPTLQSIASSVVGVGMSQFGSSTLAAVAAMFAFHAIAVKVAAALVQLRTAASGAGLAALLTPVGLLTAAVGLLTFAFIATRDASFGATAAMTRQRDAVLALRDASTEAASSQQRLRDAKIALKQATLDVNAALRTRRALDADGKRGTDEFAQAQVNVERAYSGRIRAEREVKSAQDAVTDSAARSKAAIQGLTQAAETAREKFRGGTQALGEFGNEAGKSRLVAAYATEMQKLAAQADRVAKNSKDVAPNISAAAAAFARTARAAANVAEKTGEIPEAFNKVVGPTRTAGSNIGTALGQGIKSGIDSQVGGIAAAAANAVRQAEAAARAEAKAKSPSQLFAAIGYDIGEGLKLGIVSQYKSLNEKAKTAVDGMIATAAQAVTDGKSVFSSAFEGLTSAALAAFDKLSADFQTKTEKKIAAQDEARAAKDRADALAEAQAKLQHAQATVGGATLGRGASAEDRAAFMAAEQELLDAQKEVADAQAAIQRAADEKAAAKERKEYEAKRERQRFHLDQRLAALQENFLKGELTTQQFNERMRQILKAAEIPMQKRAEALGLALAAGLTQAQGQAVSAAQAVVAAIQRALNNIVISVRVVTTSGNPSHRALGGPVERGEPYIVGERGKELFVPSQSGTIIPNRQLAMAGGGSGLGGGTVVFNFPNYVGSQSELRQAMGEVISDYKRRNGSLPF